MTGFETFGPEHLLWLVILAAAGTVLYRAASVRNGRNGTDLKERVMLAAAVFPVLGRVLPALYEIRKGIYGPDSLPLHVCSMAGYGCLLHFVLSCKADRSSGGGRAALAAGRLTALLVLSELLFFPGLPGALMALLFPGWGWCAPFSFLSICEFLGHGGIVLYVLLRLRDGGICPGLQRAWIPMLFCAVYALVMIPFDRMTGMNYGFLLLPSPDSPLSGIAALTGSGIGYYAGYALLVLGIMAASYALVLRRK